MSTNSRIEWTDTTWNPVVGCTPVSPGCLNCYAATFAARGMHERYVGLTVRRNGEGGRTRAVFNGTVRTVPEVLDAPLRWRKPRRVFVNSMSDLFHEAVPFEFVDRVWAVMALTPQHTYQVLTKRPERMAEYLAENGFAAGWKGSGGPMRDRVDVEAIKIPGVEWRKKNLPPPACHKWPLPNVWLGTSVERQQEADERIPHLLRCPAAVRFLSCEPLLGEIELGFPQGCRGCNHPGNIMPVWNSNGRCSMCDGTRQERETEIHWVIVGGESGPGARPCDVAWIRYIVDQCALAEVPCFVKQLGANVHADTMCSLRSGVNQWKGSSDDGWRWKLFDKKGGNPEEWPADLRVREFPEPTKRGAVKL